MCRRARLAQRAAQLVFSLQRLETCWRVHLRRGHTRETICDRGDGHMAQKGRGIFLVYVDIDAQHDKDFNDWYNTEHLPELLAVPGILAAARYQAVKGGPKYLACYELDNMAVMHTPAFTNPPPAPGGQRGSPSGVRAKLTRIFGGPNLPRPVRV